MAVEDVSEPIGWEARRVAAAIGAIKFRLNRYEYSHVSPFKHVSYSATHANYLGLCGEGKFSFYIVAEGTSPQDIRRVVLQSLAMSEADGCMVYRKVIDSTHPELVWGPWDRLELSHSQVRFREHLVRTLYRLGIDMEDEAWLAPLNVSLSAHEKLELRLSMPREFWPKTWVEEEEKAVK